MHPVRRLGPTLATLAILAGCGAAPEQRFTAEVRTAEVGGTEIAWYERGSGPPLMMLMGTGSTMAEWDPALLELLAERHRLILFDYPGVGLSGPWQGRTFDDLAETTAGLMEEIGIEGAGVLGWSMGGFVAQRLAIEHPERVDSLILAGTNPGGTRAALGTPEAQKIDSDPDPSDAQILQELYPPDRQAEGRRFLSRLESASQSGAIPDDFDVPSRTVDLQVAAEDPWLRSNENYEELAEISVPTFVAAGWQDPVTPPPNARTIADRIPGARSRVFAGAHAFLFQDRENFARAVDDVTGVAR
jgi:pimeloyl-ACP methyl ester carboxylesterase